MIGPVFSRELAVAPRRPRLYITRAVYAAAFVVLMSTAWLVLWGTQVSLNVGDMARFGGRLFRIIAPIQLALVLFLSATTAASAVAQEKDRRTLLLLLMTQLSNIELVLGKLCASLLHVFAMVAAALPVFALTLTLGGVSWEQIGRVFAVTLSSAIVAGSIGVLYAFWREKTFQTLALTVLTICFWLVVAEILRATLAGRAVGGIAIEGIVAGVSPIRAILDAAQPIVPNYASGHPWGNPVWLYLAVTVGISFLLNLVSIMGVRRWNPSREVRQVPPAVDDRLAPAANTDEARERRFEEARGGHVDSRLRASSGTGQTRQVWDNPILWREICTWAYGRKVLAIRIAYIVLAAMALLAVHDSVQHSRTAIGRMQEDSIIPSTAKPLVPLLVISLVVINALSVTSVTTERDGQALDLLLATDLTPSEFVLGKLYGVLAVAGLMVALPMGICIYLWARGGLSHENMLFLFVGYLVMVVFSTTLGIHCGMAYSSSRSAIGVSLGTIFFVFLGVVTCMLMIISFSGSFQVQLWPFVVFILGGGIGLFYALGKRNPSKAIYSACLILPFATFYAITSFLTEHFLAVFLMVVGTYGYATAAMLIPALHEFDFAMGRTTTADE
ncbi:MAG: hypothetical protein R3E01_29095 [Pirellulaceae bacterium]|nr:ABC transporter permease [Planctomycetales bacterium]